MDNNNLIPFQKNDAFSFRCAPDVACFNECCQDLNQTLTPYDILRIKKFLGLSSGDFLDRYTNKTIGMETGLPVISIKTKSPTDLRCIFVEPYGCKIYEHRPGSCRTYPFARVLSKNRKTGELTEQYVLIKEDHCLGFNEKNKQTLDQWIDSQAIRPYNETNDLLMTIIQLINSKKIIVNQDFKERFYMACYDLDRFREFASINKIWEHYKISKPEEDLDLLKFAFRWLGEK